MTVPHHQRGDEAREVIRAHPAVQRRRPQPTAPLTLVIDEWNALSLV